MTMANQGYCIDQLDKRVIVVVVVVVVRLVTALTNMLCLTVPCPNDHDDGDASTRIHSGGV